MPLLLLQSPLVNFANLITSYLAEIWDFLIFIGQASGVIIVLVGAILWFTETNQSKGKGLVMSGVLLSIVIEYFVLFPPSFVHA
jgi:amino acid permease